MHFKPRVTWSDGSFGKSPPPPAMCVVGGRRQEWSQGGRGEVIGVPLGGDFGGR